MARGVNWGGERFRAGLRKEMTRRIKTASIYLSSVIKADISQSGTLRHRIRNAKGRYGKTKTVYNFTHSRPFNPPFKQTGTLRRTITYEVADQVGRIGTNLKYGKYLETGTKKMKPRYYLEHNLLKQSLTIKRIITSKIPAGSLPGITSNQFRPGVMGRG